MSQAAPVMPFSVPSPAAPPAETMLLIGQEKNEVAAFDASGNLVQTEVLPVNGTDGAANSLFVHPLLQNAGNVRSILVCDARQLVIPEALYDDATVNSYFRSCFYLSPEEDLVVTRVSGAPFRVATVCALPVVRLIKQRLPATGVFAMGAAVLHTPQSVGPFARVLLVNGIAYFAVWRDGQLLEATASTTETAYDLAYLLFALAQKNGISIADLQVQVESLMANDEVAQELESFIPENRLTVSATSPNRMAAPFARIRSCVS